MTDNLTADADPADGYEDRHMFHAYVGGDEDACPCEGCSEERRADFDTEEEWSENEQRIEEEHSESVGGWVRRMRGPLSRKDANHLREVHNAQADAYNAYQTASARRSFVFHNAHSEGASHSAIAEAVGIHPSAVQQAIARYAR